MFTVHMRVCVCLLCVVCIVSTLFLCFALKSFVNSYAHIDEFQADVVQKIIWSIFASAKRHGFCIRCLCVQMCLYESEIVLYVLCM